MSETVQLIAKDGFALDGYVARPEGEPIGGLVIIQEIFGVNPSIQSVADSYAKDGFLAVAPAIFDRIAKHVQLGYEGDDMKKAFELYGKVKPAEGLPEKALEDVGAAIAYLKEKLGPGKKVGTVGFCFGGLLSWLSATQLNPDAAVGYYAGGIGQFAEGTPKAPVLLHFGRKDDHIGADQVEKVHTLHPEVEICWYDDSGHAFANFARASYVPEAAKLARERSLAFLKKNLA